MCTSKSICKQEILKTLISGGINYHIRVYLYSFGDIINSFENKNAPYRKWQFLLKLNVRTRSHTDTEMIKNSYP